MGDYSGLREAIGDSRAIVTCLDGALVDGRTAGGIGKRYLKQAMKDGHYLDVAWGAANYPVVLAKASLAGEAAGLSHFFWALGKTGHADIEAGRGFAREYIEKHQIPGARDFFQRIKSRYSIPVICASIGCDLAVDAAEEFFGFDHTLSNPVRYDEHGIITGVDIVIDDEDKFEKVDEFLERVGPFRIGECFAIGNDALDGDLMALSRACAASPLATRDIRELADKNHGFVIEDYREALSAL